MTQKVIVHVAMATARAATLTMGRATNTHADGGGGRDGGEDGGEDGVGGLGGSAVRRPGLSEASRVVIGQTRVPPPSKNNF